MSFLWFRSSEKPDDLWGGVRIEDAINSACSLVGVEKSLLIGIFGPRLLDGLRDPDQESARSDSEIEKMPGEWVEWDPKSPGKEPPKIAKVEILLRSGETLKGPACGFDWGPIFEPRFEIVKYRILK